MAKLAPVIAMRDVTKAFSGVRVLESVDFELLPGEVHALMGGNGAGKSTLMKILEGVYTLDTGSIEVDGEKVHFASGAAARRHGIAMIFQEFSLIPTLTVAQNIFLNREPHGLLGTIDDRESNRRARELFADLGVEIDVRARVGALSTSYWQLTEIAKAIAQDAHVLIMDEPTSSLAKSETQALFSLIRRLKEERGISIIYISHRLEEVFEIADRITVLRDGRLVGTEDVSKITPAQAIEMIVGHKVKALEWHPRKGKPSKEPVLELRDIRVGSRVRGLSLDLYGGEIVGLAGLMGSGRTELVQALFGIDHIDSGEVRVNGRPLRIKSAADAIEAGIALIPEDRRVEGLVLSHTVQANLTLTLLRSLSSVGVIRRRLEMSIAEELSKRLNITEGALRRAVRMLSGGNQQKVVIAKWLGRDPDILLMDEPTAGIDIGTKGEIVEIMRQLADAGKAIIMISSELVEMLAVCDRILIIRDGTITGSYQREAIKSEEALHAIVQQAA